MFSSLLCTFFFRKKKSLDCLSIFSFLRSDFQVELLLGNLPLAVLHGPDVDHRVAYPLFRHKKIGNFPLKNAKFDKLVITLIVGIKHRS